nr:hypothetical protein [uncultured Pedobacter sp.]
MDNALVIFNRIITNTGEFEKISFQAQDIDFYFKLATGPARQELKDLLKALDIDYDDQGKIISAKTKSRTENVVIYPNYDGLFSAIYGKLELAAQSSFFVLDQHNHDFYYYDQPSQNQPEWMIDNGRLQDVFWMKNFRLYLPLLKIFREGRHISEFDDIIKKRILIIDNGKERNFANVSYNIFDRRLFSKRIQFNDKDFSNRLSAAENPDNRDWLAIFKHNAVSLLSAQEDENKTFTELFLNLPFLIQNADRDYVIFMSGFSFEKIKKELKEEKQKYFDDLNQAQEKIKGQVIAVPLSIGTSIYALFQITASEMTYWCILAMVGIYIGFICWYLALYDSDLRKLRADIQLDSSKFEEKYPKVFEMFKADFKYIKKKVRAVLILSHVIKIVIILDWIALLLYIWFVIRNQPDHETVRFHLL